jgi:hypothetical protein
MHTHKATKKSARGRPIEHPVTANQQKSIVSRFKRGETQLGIAEALGLHPFAVLRVRRMMLAGVL